MARKPLPDDRELLSYLLGRIRRYLDSIEPLLEKMGRLARLYRKSIDDPTFSMTYPTVSSVPVS